MGWLIEYRLGKIESILVFWILALGHATLRLIFLGKLARRAQKRSINKSYARSSSPPSVPLRPAVRSDKLVPGAPPPRTPLLFHPLIRLIQATVQVVYSAVSNSFVLILHHHRLHTLAGAPPEGVVGHKLACILIRGRKDDLPRRGVGCLVVRQGLVVGVEGGGVRVVHGGDLLSL